MLNLQNFKNFLKEQAATIRATKSELKAHQKKHSGYDGGYFKKLKNLSNRYRHYHIAYSMLRGRVYENIESASTKVLPDMDKIKEIRDAYTKDVCASQI